MISFTYLEPADIDEALATLDDARRRAATDLFSRESLPIWSGA